MAGTGSLENNKESVFRHLPPGLIYIKFTAGSDLKEGEEVYISGDMTVSGRSGNKTEILLGHSVEDIASGEDVNIAVLWSGAIAEAVAGAAITAGQLLTQDVPANFNTKGKPQYLVAGAGEYAAAIALEGGAANDRINVAFLPMPFLVA